MLSWSNFSCNTVLYVILLLIAFSMHTLGLAERLSVYLYITYIPDLHNEVNNKK